MPARPAWRNRAGRAGIGRRHRCRIGWRRLIFHGSPLAAPRAFQGIAGAFRFGGRRRPGRINHVRSGCRTGFRPGGAAPLRVLARCQAMVCAGFHRIPVFIGYSRRRPDVCPRLAVAARGSLPSPFSDQLSVCIQLPANGNPDLRPSPGQWFSLPFSHWSLKHKYLHIPFRWQMKFCRPPSPWTPW